MSDQHSDYPPSSMYRLIACPGSAQELINAPPQEQSKFAARGSLLHECTEILDEKGSLPTALLLEHDITMEERAWVQSALDYKNFVLSQCGSEVDVAREQQVALTSWGFPEVWGTLDYQILDVEQSILHIFDWKYGQNIVEATNNAQLLTYGAAAAGHPSQIEEVHLHIVQPPRDHYDVWVVSYSELYNWVYETLGPALRDAQSPNPQYVPGEDQCRWCPIKLNCPARHTDSKQKAKKVFEAYTALQGKTITNAELAEVWEMGKDFLRYYSQIALYLNDEYLKGRPTPGVKLIAGRKVRAFSDTEKVEKYLIEAGHKKEHLWTQKFLSPAQAEKLDKALKKDEVFQSFVNTKMGKPTLVKEDHPKPALELQGAQQAFDEYIND